MYHYSDVLRLKDAITLYEDDKAERNVGYNVIETIKPLVSEGRDDVGNTSLLLEIYH